MGLDSIGRGALRLRAARLPSAAAALLLCAAAALLLSAAAAAPAAARDRIRAVAATELRPYVAEVVRLFGEGEPFLPPPEVAVADAGRSLRDLCAGAGEETLDVAVVNRAMTADDRVACRASGVIDIAELKIGEDAVVAAAGAPGLALGVADIHRAAGRWRLVDGQLLPNRAARWSDVDARLPDRPVRILLPAADHGTRSLIDSAVLLAGCRADGVRAALEDAGYDAARADAACLELRADGRAESVAAGDAGVRAGLAADPDAVGFLGRGHLSGPGARLHALDLSGTDAAGSAEDPLRTPVYVIVKKAHLGLVPGLRDFVALFAADAVAGPGAPLAAAGLIPVTPADRAAARSQLFGDNGL